MLHAAYFIILRSMAGGYLENRPFWSQTPSHATFPAVASLFFNSHSDGPEMWTRTEFDFVYIYSRNQGSHFQKKNLQNSAYSSHLFQIYIILFLYMSTTWSCKFRQEKPSISFVEVLGFWHWQSARGTSQESLLFFLWEMSFPQVLDGQGERIRKISSKTKRASWKIIILSRIYFKLLFFYCHGGVVPLVIRSISPSFSTLIQTFGTKQSPSESESCLLNFREHGHYKWVYTPYK